MIGAGPKAVAIAAKRKALSELDVVVPHLRVVDPNGLAAHWTGEHGYTDGDLPLGTPPEKDVGFPYTAKEFGSREANRSVDRAMLPYSWAAFRIAHPTQNYADWVDRGKPAPTHTHWADYLEWVADEVGLRVEQEQIRGITLKDGRWRLRLGSGHSFETDGLVITSPGPPQKKFQVEGSSDRLFDGRNFWLSDSQKRISDLAHHRRERGQAVEACVIGSGETAAAIVVQLVKLLPRESPIDVVSRGGIVYTRGESHDENRLYSNPEKWLEFPDHVREEFVKRTDRGVFSVSNKEILNQSFSVETVAGQVRSIEASGSDLFVHFKDGQHSSGYQLVVDATGFRPDWFLDLMSHDALAALADVSLRSRSEGARRNPFGVDDVGENERVDWLTSAIGPDLAVEGFSPALHLPMMAAISQGPGFPNLSCLGLVSDRILRRYCASIPHDDADRPDDDLARTDS